jgi:GTPase
MKFHFLFCVFLLLFFSNLHTQHVIDCGSNFTEYFDKYFKHYQPGVYFKNAVITIVCEGKTVFNKGYGNKSFNNSSITSAETTKYKISSLSSFLTSLIGLKLIESNKIIKNDFFNFKDCKFFTRR